MPNEGMVNLFFENNDLLFSSVISFGKNICRVH